MTLEDNALRAFRRKDRAPCPPSPLVVDASASCSLAMIQMPTIAARPRLATRIPDAGSSGIVDVADLAHGLGSIPSTPLLPIPADPRPVERPQQERGLLWAMTAAAALSVLAIVGLAVTSEPPTIVVRTTPTVPSLAVADAGERAAHEPHVATATAAPAPHEIAPDEERLADTDADADARLQALALAEAKERPAKAPRSSSTRTSARTSTPTPKQPAPTPAPKAVATGPKTAPKTTVASVPSVECVLDPASCGLGTTKSTTLPGGASATVPTPPAELPAKLGTTALRQVLGGAKATAQACGPRHGATTGTQVQVKLSIEGATGHVRQATAQGEHAGTALGRCVAEALADPVFPRFSAPQQGVVYPIRL